MNDGLFFGPDIVMVPEFHIIGKMYGSKYTFKSSLCARFRYIGQHHYYDLNRQRAKEMYSKIYQFLSNEKERYTLLSNEPPRGKPHGIFKRYLI